MSETTTYRERKAARKEYYENYVHGWKTRPCSACAGTGHYDHNGSPKCGSCEGTGKERYKLDKNDIRGGVFEITWTNNKKYLRDIATAFGLKYRVKLSVADNKVLMCGQMSEKLKDAGIR